jgi:uncharacterized protein involved in exopolysaccharide biosynthesis
MSTTTKPDPNPRRSRGIFSRITRRWSLILLVWLGLSLPTMFLIHQFVEPTFEAFSIVRVTPNPSTLFQHSEQTDFKSAVPYLQTQIGLITSDRVLAVALARPHIAKLSTIANADDPRDFLRKTMTVEIVKDAYLIRVALELADRNQAADIVNSVVASYLEVNIEHQRSSNTMLRKSLADQIKKYATEIDKKREELNKLHQHGFAGHLVDAPTLNESGKASDPTRATFVTVTEAQAQRIADEMISTDLELIKTQSLLDVTQIASDGKNEPHLRQNLSELRINIAALLAQREAQVKYFKNLKVQRKTDNADSFEAGLINRQLDTLLRRQEQVVVHLNQLEFESSQENVRVELLDPAVAPGAPTHNKQLEYMAAAPIVILLAGIGIALLTPLKGSRAWSGE